MVVVTVASQAHDTLPFMHRSYCHYCTKQFYHNSAQKPRHIRHKLTAIILIILLLRTAATMPRPTAPAPTSGLTPHPRLTTSQVPASRVPSIKPHKHLALPPSPYYQARAPVPSRSP